MSQREPFLYVLRPTRPQMLTEGPTEREAEVVGAHLRHLQALGDRGVVRLAGRTVDTGADTFGLVVFEADSAAAARELMAADPAVAAGLMVAQLYPFRVAVTGAAPDVA